MSLCPLCSRDVVTARLSADETIVLEIGPATYVCADVGHIYPEDGCVVFRSSGLVDHAVLCSGARQQQAAQRKEGKKLYGSTHAKKAGV